MAPRGGATARRRYGRGGLTGERRPTPAAAALRASEHWRKLGRMLEGVPFELSGGCTCRDVRYRVTREPLIVHCCHCRWCQRESGASFALNALVEAEHVTLLEGQVDVIDTPSASGKGQKISRCPSCRVSVWSNYAGGGAAIRFVRIGTLDEPDRLPPSVHIFTASKQPWVIIPQGAVRFDEYYQASKVWPAASLERRERVRARLGRP